MSAISQKRTFRSFSESYSIRPDTRTNLPQVVILSYHRAQFEESSGEYRITCPGPFINGALIYTGKPKMSRPSIRSAATA